MASETSTLVARLQLQVSRQQQQLDELSASLSGANLEMLALEQQVCGLTDRLQSETAKRLHAEEELGFLHKQLHDLLKKETTW